MVDLRLWFYKHTLRPRRVAGLHVSADGAQLVILEGDAHAPYAVRCADKQLIPSAWIKHGVVQEVQALAHWLKQYLKVNGYVVDEWLIGLEDAQVLNYTVSLPVALSFEDVTFQLQQETRELFVDHAKAFALDYEIDEDDATHPRDSRRYLVSACPAVCADGWLEVARAEGFHFSALEPERDALARLGQAELTGAIPAANLALALQCDVALGLALGSWSRVSYNFLPHRPLWRQALRRAWWMGLGVCALGGAILAAGFAMVMSAATDITQERVDLAGQAAEQILAQARQGYQQAQSAQKLQTLRMQWLQNRQAMQAQSLAWSEVLSQASQGIWISHIHQQGEHWLLEGEALSAAHAQRLLGSLKALDIWAKSPDLPHLQIGASAVAGASTGRATVWVFRIEGELKAGG